MKNPLAAFDGPPATRPRASPSAIRPGNQGLILGILGCCLGVLGIFTLGLLFVPIAALFSLFGLIRALANRSTAGALMSIVGMTLSAIGFYVSPSLWLVAGGLLVASQTPDRLAPSQSQPMATRSNSIPLPDTEQRFCDITSAATSRYFSLASDDAKAARDAKNGILAKRADDGMTSATRDRNTELFKLVRETNFTFDKWSVRLLSVSAPNEKRVSFAVRPSCSNIVTIHLVATANSRVVDALAAQNAGDPLVVSGTFAGSRLDTDDAPTTPSVEHFESSITEQGSMEEPEYWAQLRY